MSAVAFQLERAVARYLTGAAPLLVAGSGEYLLTDEGAVIRLTGGFVFTFGVFPGQSACEVDGPCLVAYVPTGVQSEAFTMNHRCVVEVSLKYPADDDANIGNRQELLDAFLRASGALVNALYVCNLAEVLMMQDPTLLVLPVNGPRIQRSGFEGRLRVFKVEFEVVAAPMPEEVHVNAS